MNQAKLTKDVRDLADIVLMTEIKRNEDAINHFNRNLQTLYAERDRRVAEHIQVTGQEMRKDPVSPEAAGSADEQK